MIPSDLPTAIGRPASVRRQELILSLASITCVAGWFWNGASVDRATDDSTCVWQRSTGLLERSRAVNQELLVLFPVSVACDVAGQVFFKLGADRLTADRAHGVTGFLHALISQPWLIGGIAIFTFETFVWLRILAQAPLSIAFPIASLNFIGVTLASRFLFREDVGMSQWLGCLLVTIGVGVLAVSSAS